MPQFSPFTLFVPLSEVRRMTLTNWNYLEPPIFLLFNESEPGSQEWMRSLEGTAQGVVGAKNWEQLFCLCGYRWRGWWEITKRSFEISGTWCVRQELFIANNKNNPGQLYMEINPREDVKA